MGDTIQHTVRHVLILQFHTISHVVFKIVWNLIRAATTIWICQRIVNDSVNVMNQMSFVVIVSDCLMVESDISSCVFCISDLSQFTGRTSLYSTFILASYVIFLGHWLIIPPSQEWAYYVMAMCVCFFIVIASALHFDYWWIKTNLKKSSINAGDCKYKWPVTQDWLINRSCFYTRSLLSKYS